MVGGFNHFNLKSELGYIRAVSVKNGQYDLTFDSADWLLNSTEAPADSGAIKNIKHYLVSPYIYSKLQGHYTLLNVPMTIYLDQNNQVVKISPLNEAR